MLVQLIQSLPFANPYLVQLGYSDAFDLTYPIPVSDRLEKPRAASDWWMWTWLQMTPLSLDTLEVCQDDWVLCSNMWLNDYDGIFQKLAAKLDFCIDQSFN